MHGHLTYPAASRVLMGLPVHDLELRQTTAAVIAAVEARRAFSVATPNVDYVFRADRSPAFREALLAADLRVPDGVWIVRVSRIARRPLRGSTAGRLLIPTLAAEAERRGWGIALVGAPPGVAEDAARRLRAVHPQLRIEFADAPPMGFRIGDYADRALVARLAATDARIVVVGLGAPKQELWMAAHREELGGRALLGIGAGIDIVAGRFREAPDWMVRNGLAWAFRLAQEPRRLARRYLVDDPQA
ncbi:MAG: WecB/TagA/CpsF family glycosyltransferase, partial [Chloroflexota bacterium]